MNQIKFFKVKSSGANLTLQFGFVPDYLKLVNVTAMSAGNKAVLEWFGALMGDAREVEHVCLADNGTTAKLTINYVATGGYVAEFDTVAVQTSDPVKVTGGLGVTITASGFASNDDEIYGIAIQGDIAVDLGDQADKGNTLDV